METAEAILDSNFLELNQNPIRFEPVSKLTNVFFDEASKQIFVVRSGGATGVVVKGPDEKTSTDFRMEDKGGVISIKFSPDKKVLAIQRCSRSVEFVNFGTDIETIEYSQCCKGKNTQILGFVWTAVNEVVFVTDHGIELYQAFPEKRILKSLKTHSVSVNWFVYHPEACLLVVSSGTLGNILHSFQFRPSTVYKLPKFEVDLPLPPKPVKLCLYERDITVGTIYGKACIIVLRHQVRASGTTGAEIVLYTLQKDGPPRKTNILKLDMSGRFATNIVDDLIIVHHQTSKTSLLFDIKLPGEENGFVTYHTPIVRPLPIKPFKLKMPTVPSHGSFESLEISCELYSPNWVIFQPNIIIDAKLGCLWHIQLGLEPLVDLISDKCTLIDFLMMRKHSKEVILNVCHSCLVPETRANLPTISRIFDRLNQVLKMQTVAMKTMPAGVMIGFHSDGKQCVVIDQSDMYSRVFSAFENQVATDFKFVVAVLLEYIRSLTQNQIQVQHYLYELLINTMVRNNCFYQLHQFLQYYIFADSKPLACLLLSIQKRYPAANQMALDMLMRLGKATDEIVEVLLEQKQVLSALRFMRSVGNTDAISPRKFLEVAQNIDPGIFFTVFKFFELRNVRLRGLPHFEPGEHCEPYVKHFEKLFGTMSSLSAIYEKGES